ncbi:MAG: D-threonate 4-phosphate dehydrogenase [Haliscomenobacter sp.]|jgi:4-hydroxythreonine-4-phosphate dehydrogenase|nr:D-threonate 4-phosphate dehydrogenase [Haliscomenobacter sp.]
MDKPKIGITIGDINGIGLEVILKTLANPQIINFCTPVVYGSTKVISYHKNIVGIDFHFNSIQRAERMPTDKINILNCWQENVNITLGKATEMGGQYAIKSLECATKDLKQGLIDALVTAPIHKEAMQMAGFPYPGHTEYLTKELGVDESLMFLVADQLRVGLVTNHLPLKDVAGQITKERILKKIQIMEASLRIDFGIDRPTIAVLGLNPHAGDGGVIGDEDDRIIRPAVIECKKNGLLVVGPFPADGFFGSGGYKKFDAILAMYHDQGLIPFKLLTFGGGINFTAGLPGVRTSPDHGTAFDLAGKNEADPDSFREALFAAIDIARNRKDYYDSRANALTKRTKIAVESEDGEEEIDDLVEEEEGDDENE